MKRQCNNASDARGLIRLGKKIECVLLRDNKEHIIYVSETIAEFEKQKRLLSGDCRLDDKIIYREL